MKIHVLLPLMSAVGLGASAPREELPVLLPPVTVLEERELPPRESWRYTTIPDFEILASIPTAEGRKLVRDFQLFRDALAQVWPLSQSRGQATLIILCGAHAQYDAFVPAAAKTDPQRAAFSVFLHDRSRAAIVVDCAAKTAGIISDAGKDDIPVEASRELYRQYVHVLMSRADPPPPAWFIEGFAQIAKAMEFDRTNIVFGQLQEPDLMTATKETTALRARAEVAVLGGRTTDRSIVPPDAFAGFADNFADIDFGVQNKGFLDLLKGKSLMTLDRFFAVPADSVDVLASLGTTAVWPQEAYAFVHLCLFGEGGKYQKPLAKFVQRLRRESPSEPLFKACFNLSYEEMMAKLHAYQDVAYYSYLKYRAKGDGLPSPTESGWREATPAEVGRIKGTSLDLAGRPALAYEALIAPYIRRESDPPLLAALGLWERTAGHDERARKLLEAAYAAETALRPEARIELARYRHREATAKPEGAKGGLSPAQVERITQPLLGDQSQPPPFGVAYELLADTWRQAEKPPTVAQVEMLIRGAQLNPTRFELLLNTALLCDAVGLRDPARALAEHGARYAPEAAKPRFANLLTRLQ